MWTCELGPHTLSTAAPEVVRLLNFPLPAVFHRRLRWKPAFSEPKRTWRYPPNFARQNWSSFWAGRCFLAVYFTLELCCLPNLIGGLTSVIWWITLHPTTWDFFFFCLGFLVVLPEIKCCLSTGSQMIFKYPYSKAIILYISLRKWNTSSIIQEAVFVASNV